MPSNKDNASNTPSFDNRPDGPFFNTNPLPMYFFDMENYDFLAVNEAAIHTYGYSRDEFLKMKASQIRPPEEVARFMESVAGAHGPYLESKGEWQHTLKSGEIIDVELIVSLADFNGRKAILSMVHDITERKRAEAALRKSESKYRELIESMPVAYYKTTPAGRFIEVNPAFCRMVGYTSEELFAMDIPKTLYFEESEREGEKRYSGFAPVTEIYRLKRKDGSEVWMEDYARYLRDESGKIIFHEGICQDITEQKLAREALQSSEARLRTVIDSSSDAVVFLDSNWNLMECLNPVCYERITGYLPAERLGRSAFDVIHPDDLETLRSQFRTRQDEKVGATRSEYRIKHKDGTWRWVEGVARDMLEEPSIKALVIGIRDIEERKFAEKRLVESEERYRVLVHNSPDSIVVLTDGKLVYVNHETLGPMHAESEEQLIGRSILDFIHPDSRQDVIRRIEDMIKTQKDQPLHEMKLVGLDGAAVQVEVRSAPVTYFGKLSIQSVIRNVTDRRQVEKRLHLQSVALNTAANGIVITDTSGNIVWANPAFGSLTGYSLNEAVGSNMRDLIKSGKQDQEFYRNMWNTILAGQVWRGEIINKRKDGTLYTEDMTIAPVREGSGEITHFVAVKQDITDRKSLQEQLLQSQKLESIGQLAGGVAHDYNNILGVIIGYGELLKSKLRDDFEAQRPVEAILTASTRAADLTRQLLAFARKDIISPRVVNINSSLEIVQKMLKRIIGENINFVFRPGDNLWNVRIDPSQLDQVLINLAANSKDAIQGVGVITIETSNVSVDAIYAKGRPGLRTGDFVRLVFSDTGAGMESETVRRIFEPFFTTKEKGHGTGLGLSTVYGIVKQNNGEVFVTSGVGEGTSFEIFLPRFIGEVEGLLDMPPEPVAHGTETILVVEDQEDILELTRASLENYGYRVLTASSPNEALMLCKAHAGEIHLLLTDVIMPVMSGKDLSGKARELRPGMKVIYMSGYTANELSPKGVLGEEFEFIQKPFTPVALAKRVGDVLNS